MKCIRTIEELNEKIDKCLSDSQMYDELDEYLAGYYAGQADVYEEWLHEIEPQKGARHETGFCL